MQHNDQSPVYHPTDAGHIKVASHLMQFIKLKFDWNLYVASPEVIHDTAYWNDMLKLLGIKKGHGWHLSSLSWL